MISWRWLFYFSSKEEENNIWIYFWAARAISRIARPRYKVQQMAGAAGRAKRCTPEPLYKVLTLVAVAELKNMLTAFHKDKLSGSSSDGALRIIIEGRWFASAMLWQFNIVLGGKYLLKVFMNFLSWSWAKLLFSGYAIPHNRENELYSPLSTRPPPPSAVESSSRVL